MYCTCWWTIFCINLVFLYYLIPFFFRFSFWFICKQFSVALIQPLVFVYLSVCIRVWRGVDTLLKHWAKSQSLANFCPIDILNKVWKILTLTLHLTFTLPVCIIEWRLPVNYCSQVTECRIIPSWQSSAKIQLHVNVQIKAQQLNPMIRCLILGSCLFGRASVYFDSCSFYKHLLSDEFGNLFLSLRFLFWSLQFFSVYTLQL